LSPSSSPVSPPCAASRVPPPTRLTCTPSNEADVPFSMPPPTPPRGERVSVALSCCQPVGVLLAVA
jgi:hypothetical protein